MIHNMERRQIQGGPILGSTLYIPISIAILCIGFVVVMCIMSQEVHVSAVAHNTAELKIRSRTDLELKVEQAKSTWYACMNEAVAGLNSDSEKLFYTFSRVVKNCTATTPIHYINYATIRNNDERKFFTYSSTNTTPSIVVTLGVGQDVLAEQTLKETLPKGSSFFGADPISDGNYKLYNEVGKFFSLAVGNETKFTQAEVLVNGKYENRSVKHINIVTFLTNLTKTPFIDLLLIDIEGSEYDILPMMGVGREFDQNGIVVCQICVEVHPDPRHLQDPARTQEFSTLMKQILSDKRYIVIRDTRVGTLHRAYLVNFENPACLTKYFHQFFR